MEYFLSFLGRQFLLSSTDLVAVIRLGLNWCALFFASAVVFAWDSLLNDFSKGTVDNIASLILITHMK